MLNNHQDRISFVYIYFIVNYHKPLYQMLNSITFSLMTTKIILHMLHVFFMQHALETNFLDGEFGLILHFESSGTIHIHGWYQFITLSNITNLSASRIHVPET